MKFYAEKRMLESKGASNFPFRGGVVNEDHLDLYKKDQVNAIIARIVNEDARQDVWHTPTSDGVTFEYAHVGRSEVIIKGH